MDAHKLPETCKRHECACGAFDIAPHNFGNESTLPKSSASVCCMQLAIGRICLSGVFWAESAVCLFPFTMLQGASMCCSVQQHGIKSIPAVLVRQGVIVVC